MRRSGLTRARTRVVVIGIALVMAVAATAPAQVVTSIDEDRVQLAMDLWAFAFSAQLFVTESSAVSVALVPFGLLHSLNLRSGITNGYVFHDVVRVGFRAYPFLGDPSRLLAGISAGVQASYGAGHEYYDPRNGQPVSSLTVRGGTLAPSVGVSTRLFEWLFLEATFGTGLTVRRVMEAIGDYYAGEVGDTAAGLVPVGSFKVGVSF